MGSCCSCCKAQVSDEDNVAVQVQPSKNSLPSVSGRTGSLTALKSSGSATAAAAQITPSAVKVACVVRPIQDFELQKGAAITVAVQPPNKVALPARAGSTGVNDGAYEFQFGRVYHAASTAASQALYGDMVWPVIDRYCRGFNGTVLAYGQTGSGKTYTMGTAGGVKDISSKSSSAAVIPQAFHHVLDYIAAAKSNYDITLKVSFVEIYNEAIQDLLNMNPIGPSGSSGNLPVLRVNAANSNGGSSGGGGCSTPRSVVSEGGVSSSVFGGSGSEGGCGISIRETAKGEIVLEGVTEHVVSSIQDVAHILEQGNSVRATAAHKLNQSSSRSHAILSLTLEQRVWPAAAKQLAPELHYLRSKLHLVDLAGSERAKETGTTGQRFNEGVSINKGLLELGNVINALTEGTARKHIPYRNSKLTRLLQDSLGGNSETLFIACVSPADSNRDHTISTLRYASRAMAIKNSLKLNNTMSPDEELAYLRQVVAELQEEIDTLRKLMGSSGGGAAAAPGGGIKAVRHSAGS